MVPEVIVVIDAVCPSNPNYYPTDHNFYSKDFILQIGNAMGVTTNPIEFSL